MKLKLAKIYTQQIETEFTKHFNTYNNFISFTTQYEHISYQA